MRRLGRVGLLGAMLILCALVSVASATAAAPVPVLAPGGTLIVSVGGFAEHREVRVQLVGSTAGRTTARTDGRGRVRVSYQVPTVRGRYRLLVSGPARNAPDHRPSPSPVSTGDLQVIAVTVPLVVSVPFRVDTGGFGVLGGTIHAGDGGRGDGGLAATGADLRAPLILAGALAVLGLAATLAGRRRARR